MGIKHGLEKDPLFKNYYNSVGKDTGKVYPHMVLVRLK